MLAVRIYSFCLAFIYLQTVFLAWIVRSGADRNASGQSKPFLLYVKKDAKGFEATAERASGPLLVRY